MQTIEKMTEADIPYVADVDMQAFGKRRVEEFEEELADKNYITLVAKKDGLVVGYVSALVLMETADLVSLAVDANYRRFGFGTKLLESMVKDAKQAGCERLMLEVRKSNLPAIKLYNKLGFVPIFVREKYYEGREDAIVMKRDL